MSSQSLQPVNNPASSQPVDHFSSQCIPLSEETVASSTSANTILEDDWALSPKSVVAAADLEEITPISNQGIEERPDTVTRAITSSPSVSSISAADHVDTLPRVATKSTNPLGIQENPASVNASRKRKRTYCGKCVGCKKCGVCKHCVNPHWKKACLQRACVLNN